MERECVAWTVEVEDRGFGCDGGEQRAEESADVWWEGWWGGRGVDFVRPVVLPAESEPAEFLCEDLGGCEGFVEGGVFGMECEG